jgi:hypothetical protein
MGARKDGKVRARIWWRWVVVAMAGAMVPLACSSDESGADDDDGCARDTDCTDGQICQSRRCVPGPGSGGSAGSSASGGSSGTGGSAAGGTGGSAPGGTGGTSGSGPIYGWTEATHDASYDIQALWGSGPNEVWAAAGGGDVLGGAGQLHLFDGAAWDLFYAMATPGFTDIWGVSGGSSVFIVGRGAQFYELTETEIVTIENGDGTVPNLGVWGSARDAVWVASNSTSNPLRFWDGTRFASDQRYRSPNLAGATAVWGSSASDVWAADMDGSILHFDGTAWTQVYQVAGAVFYGIDGSGPNDVWAVGPRHLLHFDGQSWTQEADGAGMALNDVWVAAPNDVWLVGDTGRILRGGTNGFTAVESGRTESLFTIWGSSPTDIWAGGEGGVLIHYGEVETPTEPPDGGMMECSPQGFGCSMTPCCAPFRCANLGGGLLACT